MIRRGRRGLMTAHETPRQLGPEDAEQILRQYAHRLGRLAASRLPKKLARRIDEEDLVQSALLSFFKLEADGGVRINANSDLWPLLCRIVIRKIAGRIRRESAQKRAIDAEEPLSNPDVLLKMAQGPSPEDAVVVEDEIENLLKNKPPLFGSILRLRLEDWSVAEISSKLGVTRQIVYRILKELREDLGEQRKGE